MTQDTSDFWFETSHQVLGPDQQKANDKDNTKTNAFREHLQTAIFGTCELLDICSEWWKTWPDQQKGNDEDKDKYNDNDNYI